VKFGGSKKDERRVEKIDLYYTKEVL